MYFLGVDAGGTKTDAILFDTDGGAIRTVRLGPGNVCSLGEEGCGALLKEMCERLLVEVRPSAITGSTFAFAGAGRPVERGLLESIVKDIGFADYTVMTDAEILHYSFFGDRPGVLVASGTGSVCLVSSEGGVYHQLGGWGYVLGDEGSGFHIGRLAIRHALDCVNRGVEPTILTRTLLAFYQATSPRKLVSLTYSSQGPQSFVASCAQAVVELAEGGDGDALEVIDRAAGALVELAKKGIDAYDRTGSGAINIALAGGILSGETVMARRFKEMIAASEGGIQYFAQQCNPAAAAVVYSMVRCGHRPCEKEMQMLSGIELNRVVQ